MKSVEVDKMSTTKSNVPDVASNQLVDYGHSFKKDEDIVITTSGGNPVPYKDASLTVGPRGPTLLQDKVLIDELAHFTRERIPERVVHAKGSGAFGYFEVTDDITEYCASSVFSEIGKKTPVAARFSQVFGEKGYADTVRDVRGFAVKFYTEEGIWDIVGNNTPVFFVQDASLFPSFIHALKRNPVTDLRDFTAFWDFISLRPETTHQTLILYSDRGLPNSYRTMHGYGSNTFGLVNAKGDFHYCKFHFITDQGIENMDPDFAMKLAGEDPDYLRRDLYNNIATENFPSWTMHIQVMTPEQATTYKYNPFDVTKVWLHADFPLIKVGKFTLNRNPANYFAEIEQLSFDPAHMTPGIEPSPDKMLQGRIFNYGDAGRYRLGVNNDQIPVNSPNQFHNFARDGFATFNNQGGAPNYHPNSFGGPDASSRAKLLAPVIPLDAKATRYDNGDEDNYSQAQLLYEKVLTPKEQDNLSTNLAEDIAKAADFIQERVISMFANVNKELSDDIKRKINGMTHKTAEI